MTAQDELRAQLLADMLGDCVPMAHVESVITRGHLADTVADRHELALSTIRSLLEDGLMEIGDVSGGEPATLLAWNLPLDAAMDGRP